MPRNLDLTSLRSFVAVHDAGGVTRAARLLNLTQSAVSMQLKRLEENLGLDLMDRSGRAIGLTASGEQLLSYARRMLALNDEAFSRLTDTDFEGEIVLGVPHDILYPAIPAVLRQFSAAYPRMHVNLLSLYTKRLHEMFAKGEVDVMLTTEEGGREGAECIAVRALKWVGAVDGKAWKARPLRLAFEKNCIFRGPVQKRLDAEGIPWQMTMEGASSRTVETAISADLGVHVALDGTLPPYTEVIEHRGDLPELASLNINLYRSELAGSAAADTLCNLLRMGFAVSDQQSAPRPFPSTVSAA